MRKLTLVFEKLENIHLIKEVGIIPYYLSEYHGYEVEIVCYAYSKNREMRFKSDNIKIIRINRFFDSQRFYWLGMLYYLVKHANKIGGLMLYFLDGRIFWYMFFLKLLNPKCFFYIKLDLDRIRFGSLNHPDITDLRSKLNHKKLNFQIRYIFKKANLLSVETKEIYGRLFPEWKGVDLREKLILLPSGFDDKRTKVRVKSFKEKENIILTIGRLGSKQKNTEMLMSALEEIEDFKDWKVYLIGPIENRFKTYIKDYFERNPLLQNKIVFLGAIYKRDVLFEWLNRSKVFCLTSSWESFGNVLNEAGFFGNYIVSTNVGAALDITDNGKLGEIIEVNDVSSLKEILEKIIKRGKDISEYSREIHKFCKENFVWSKIVDKLDKEIKSRQSIQNF